MAKRRSRARGASPGRPSAGLAPVLLAAGASQRLGSCKALVDLGGRTPLARLAEAVTGVADAAPLVVAGHHVAELRAALPEGCELLENPDWAAGRTGGLKLAAGARVGFDLLICPVDVPLVPASVCAELLAAWSGQGRPERGWLAPRHSGRFGHPVLLGRGLAAELLRFGPDRPLSDLRRAAEPLLGLETACAEVLDDLDTPEDLAELRRRIQAE